MRLARSIHLVCVNVRPYLEPFEAERAHAARHLLHRSLGVVHGQCAYADETRGFLGDLSRNVVVEEFADTKAVSRPGPVAEHDGHGGEHLRHASRVTRHVTCKVGSTCTSISNASISLLRACGHMSRLFVTCNAACPSRLHVPHVPVHLPEEFSTVVDHICLARGLLGVRVFVWQQPDETAVTEFCFPLGKMLGENVCVHVDAEGGGGRWGRHGRVCGRV